MIAEILKMFGIPLIDDCEKTCPLRFGVKQNPRTKKYYQVRLSTHYLKVVHCSFCGLKSFPIRTAIRNFIEREKGEEN